MFRPSLREVGGPTDLSIGSMPDGSYPRRSGSSFEGRIRRVIRKTSNQTVSSTTPADCTDLAFTGLAAGAYIFRFVLFYSAAASTTGLRVAVDYTGTVTSVRYGANIPRTAQAADWQATTLDAGQLIVTDSTTITNICELNGCIVVSTSGDLKLQFGGEVAASVTVEANSFGEIEQVS